LDILRCVSATTIKLNSWRRGNKLIKASCHLKDNPRIENYQNHKNSSQALHDEDKPRRGNMQQKMDLAVFYIFFQKRDFDNS